MQANTTSGCQTQDEARSECGRGRCTIQQSSKQQLARTARVGVLVHVGRSPPAERLKARHVLVTIPIRVPDVHMHRYPQRHTHAPTHAHTCTHTHMPHTRALTHHPHTCTHTHAPTHMPHARPHSQPWQKASKSAKAAHLHSTQAREREDDGLFSPTTEEDWSTPGCSTLHHPSVFACNMTGKGQWCSQAQDTLRGHTSPQRPGETANTLQTEP